MAVLNNGVFIVNGTSKSLEFLVDAEPKPKLVLASCGVTPPVPPLANPTTPYTLLALPAIFPITLAPLIDVIFISVMALSATLDVVIALVAIKGEDAEPDKSPDN